MADTTTDVKTLKRRGRRRLVGAVALVLAAVIVLPMVFDPSRRAARRRSACAFPARTRPRSRPKVTPKSPAIPEQNAADKAPEKAPEKAVEKAAEKLLKRLPRNRRRRSKSPSPRPLKSRRPRPMPRSSAPRPRWPVASNSWCRSAPTPIPRRHREAEGGEDSVLHRADRHARRARDARARRAVRQPGSGGEGAQAAEGARLEAGQRRRPDPEMTWLDYAVHRRVCGVPCAGRVARPGARSDLARRLGDRIPRRELLSGPAGRGACRRRCRRRSCGVLSAFVAVFVVLAGRDHAAGTVAVEDRQGGRAGRPRPRCSARFSARRAAR